MKCLIIKLTVWHYRANMAGIFLLQQQRHHQHQKNQCHHNSTETSQGNGNVIEAAEEEEEKTWNVERNKPTELIADVLLATF